MKVILFDGVCNLCNGFVNFVIERDKEGKFQFSSLQSPFAERLLKDRLEKLDSVIFYDGERIYEKSEAVFKVAETLKGYRWLIAFKIIPKGLRNWVYDMIAKNRYRAFGKRESCMMPSPELKKRFLED